MSDTMIRTQVAPFYCYDPCRYGVYMRGWKRKFVVQYSEGRVFQSAEAIDAQGRSYRATKAQISALCSRFSLSRQA